MSQRDLFLPEAPSFPKLPARALTLWQPWAWLVANGHKGLENRPVGFSHKSFRGEFWIHAGQKVDPHFDNVIQYCRAKGIMIPPMTGPDHFSAIIGRAKIVSIIPPCRVNCSHAWHYPDQYAFVVSDARLVKPVPCRGYQGFWSVPLPILERLNEST
jgi:hypothetical protein